MRKRGWLSAMPEPGAGKRGVDGHVGYLLRQAGVAFRASMEEALSDLGVTLPQFAAMTMVAAYPGLSNADLARLSLLTPQTMSLIVRNLTRAGTLRCRPHPVHGRIRRLDLTAAGKALLARCNRRVRLVEARLTAGLSAGEERAVRHWLVRVAVESRVG